MAAAASPRRLLALVLVAAIGLLVTGRPWPRLGPGPWLDRVLAAGAPPLLLGLVLGPGLGVLDPATLRAIAPVTALGVGWIGAVFGARYEWRYMRRIPPRVWLLSLFQAAAVFVLVAFTASLLGLLSAPLAAAWTPRLPALLTLAAVAIVSGPVTGARRSVARAASLAAALETGLGALAMTLGLAIYHPHLPAGGVALGWFSWLALALGSGALVGMLFLSLTRLRPEPEHLAPALLAALLFGAGVGYAADLTPFVVCALAAVLIVNLSPQRRALRALLETWQPPIYAVLLIIAGALLALPTVWVLVAVPLLWAARAAVKWAAVLLARGPLGLLRLPPNLGLATVAQGGVAVALAISFYMVYDGRGAGAVVTTILLGVMLTPLAAPPLVSLALRSGRPDSPHAEA